MSTPYVVGTPNATEDVFLHVKPGRRRAPLLRYFRFNLPRLTKLVLMVIIAVIGGSAAYTALSNHLPFAHADIALWIVVAMAILYLVVAAVTKLRIWDAGSLIAICAVLIYIGGLFGDAPYVWNGASIQQAAIWNIMMMASVAYVVLNALVLYGMFVVYPDDQNFTD